MRRGQGMATAKGRRKRTAGRRYPARFCERPIIISSVEYVTATPEQERRILGLCRAAHFGRKEIQGEVSDGDTAAHV